MGNFDEINEELEQPIMEEEVADTFEIELVTLSGVQNYEAVEGSTIAELKDAKGLARNVKIVDESGEVLRNDDRIHGNMTLYISAPKKNG